MQSDARPYELVTDTHRKRCPSACGPRAEPTENVAFVTSNDRSTKSKHTIEKTKHGEYSVFISLLLYHYRKWQRKVCVGEIQCFPEEPGARLDCHTFLPLGAELIGGCYF